MEMLYFRKLEDGAPAAGTFPAWPDTLTQFKLPWYSRKTAQPPRGVLDRLGGRALADESRRWRDGRRGADRVADFRKGLHRRLHERLGLETTRA